MYRKSGQVNKLYPVTLAQHQCSPEPISHANISFAANGVLLYTPLSNQFTTYNIGHTLCSFPSVVPHILYIGCSFAKENTYHQVLAWKGGAL